MTRHLRFAGTIAVLLLVTGFSTGIAQAAVKAPAQNAASPGGKGVDLTAGTHASGTGAADAHDTHDAHAKAPLLPATMEEFVHFFLPTMLVVAGLFVLLLIVLHPTAWRHVLAGLKQREAHIRENMAGAHRSRNQLESSQRQYNEQIAAAEASIRDTLTRAQNDGEKRATELRMKAQQEAEEAKERATREIDQTKTEALASVRDQVGNLAVSIASKVLGRELNPEQQRQTVQSAMARSAGV